MSDSRLCRRRRFLPGLLLLMTLVALPAGTQDEFPGVFSEILEVRVVNIEVVVTDKKGNRVTGLKAEDFRLFVDGEEVPIEYFTEILEGEAVELAEAPETVQSVPTLVPGSAVGTSYLVFIDDFFSIARDRNRVLERLEEDLSLLGENDRMALVAFDGRELTMLSSWTNSPLALSEALAEARERQAYGLQRLGELRVNDEDRRSRRALGATTTLLGQDRRLGVTRTHLEGIELNYALRLAQQVETSAMAAVATLRSFAAPPGRKVMLLLNGGWPYSPAEYTVNDFDATLDETIAGVFDTQVPGRQAIYGPLSDTANLLGYTLYPVDIQGFRRETGIDASRSSPVVDSTTVRTGFAREDQIHASLDFLADETGGQSLLNARRDIALEEVFNDTRSYYWLGFSPKRYEDDQRHRIRVEVLRTGLRARLRDGYVDSSRASEVTMMVESALLFGNPPTGRPLELHFGRPKKSGRGKVSIGLEVGIPLEEIVLMPVDDRYVAELEIRVTVMDDKGNRSETPVDQIRINGSRLPRPGERMWYETALKMRKRSHRIVVAVYDPLSGTILSSTTELTL